VRQTGLAEKVYAQWLNTQLVAGTAPDLAEMGMANLATKDEYTVKYYVPLGGYIGQPNPYNKGTDLEDVPWKETLLDGMRGGFREGLQAYYGVPTTFYGMRLFYNKTLLKRATGSDEAPRTFGHWMQQCDAIRKLDPDLLPIVSSYGMDSLRSKYDASFTSGLEAQVDLDLDGRVTLVETYIAYRQGIARLDTPQVKAMFDLLRTVGERMQQGFSAMDRQQSQFRFVNGQAGFMFTGSWDASGTFLQADAKGFEVGVCDLPPVAPDDPGGNFYRGRVNEAATAGGGVYGVYKGSKNVEVAVDFLRYITSRKANEKFNRMSQWPPLTIGAEPSEIMRPFAPNPVGYSSPLQFNFGQLATQGLNGALINYYQGDAPFTDAIRNYDAGITDERFGGDYAWSNEFMERRRDVRNKEGLLAQQSALELVRPGSTDPLRYRRALLQQVIRNNGMDSAYLYKKYRGKELQEP
jgi:raffinose/stachyose/melibiose transport system substrate-binding protein